MWSATAVAITGILTWTAVLYGLCHVILQAVP